MVREFLAARLSPCVRSPRRPLRLVTRFGRHQSDGTAITGWPLLHSLDTTLAVPSRAQVRDRPTKRIDAAIYGGLYYGAFGHFLTETFLNLLAVRALKQAHPDLPILFHTPDFFTKKPRADRVDGQPRAHVAEFEDRLGISAEGALLVDQPMEVGRLLVPDAPFSRKFRFKPWVTDALDDLFGPQQAPGGPIYLSRSRWPTPRILDEDRVEAIFADHGYRIVHPQDLSLSEQIALIRCASHVAGPQGTALHWSLYSGTCRSVISLGWPSPLQNGICKARHQTYVEVGGRRPWGDALRVRRVAPTRIERAIARVSG